LAKRKTAPNLGHFVQQGRKPVMLKDFRAFIARGNVLDLAVGVIIGGAFATITKSLTDDVIMPIVGALFGGFDFSSYFVRLGPVPADFKGSLASYAQLKAAGVPLLGYGEFITVVINFLILAFIVFLLMRSVNKLVATVEREKAAGDAEPAADPAEVVLLREIRDELKARGPVPPQV
jgi:large conductance mechanosensitive channel